MRVLFFHLYSYYTFFQSRTYNMTTIILHDEQGIYEIICQRFFFQFYCYVLPHRFKNLTHHILIRETLKFWTTV